MLEVFLRGLTSEVKEMPQPPGHVRRPRFPLPEAILCAILKVYSCRSGRRARGFYQVVAGRRLLSRVPSIMVASRVLNRAHVTPFLERLVWLSASPLAAPEEGQAIAPDSTGVQTTSFGAWREEKHGEKRGREWLKVHAMVGTKTHVIIRAVVDDPDSGDAPRFGPLLRGSLEWGFRPGLVTADRGYLSKANYQLATDLGVQAYIPFKSNSVVGIRSKTSPSALRKAFHLFQAN